MENRIDVYGGGAAMVRPGYFKWLKHSREYAFIPNAGTLLVYEELVNLTKNCEMLTKKRIEKYEKRNR